MTSSLSEAALHDLLASGELVLVPGSHAARLHRARLADVFAREDQRPPLAWHEWVNALWSGVLLTGKDDRVLLNRLQEEQVWTDVIGATSRAGSLSPSSVRDLAVLARSALQTAASYGIVAQLSRSADTTDARAFNEWLAAFQERCSADRLLAPALLEGTLSHILAAGHIQCPSVLHLVGFQRLTRAQERLLESCSDAGCSVHRHRLEDVGSAVRSAVEVADAREELGLAARWVAQEGHVLQPAAMRVALICPDPDARRQELDQALAEVLAPELQSNFADLSSKPWQFARQPALATYPVIAAAVEIARWIAEPLPIERVAQLLVSPFLVLSEDPELRARYDPYAMDPVHLLRGTLSLSTFAEIYGQARQANQLMADFRELQVLARAAREFGTDRALRSPADWTERLRKLLSLVGWPGPRELTHAEFRAVEGWEDLLDLLSTLQFDGSKVSFRDLVSRLAGEAQSAPALPVPYIAPVQIFTLDEAEGLFFDLVLHVDATSDTLPTTERRNPLLPQALQRQCGIGDLTVAVQEARAALEDVARRSSHLVLLAARNEDGESRLTPLADQLGFAAPPASSLPPPERETDILPTEDIVDPEGMPLAPGSEVRGGISVLQAQAQCGFRAFTTHRLAVREGSSATFGVDARNLGSVLHIALEVLWARLGSQQALRDLAADARAELVRDCLQMAFRRQRLESRADDPWTSRYLRVLKRRFVRLLSHWLECELERSPFTVLSQEAKQTVEIGPLRLSVRPDRVDLVGDEKVFVDYKTSYQLSSNDWLGERPDAPQLPVYALGTAPGNLNGIAFAQIRPGDTMGWISLTNAPGTFPRRRNKQVDLQEQLDAWREELTSLADEFARGDASLAPKQYPQTCKYCGYRTLCRLDPTDLLRDADEDEASLEDEPVG